MKRTAMTSPLPNLLDPQIYSDGSAWSLFRELRRTAPIFRHPDPSDDDYCRRPEIEPRCRCSSEPAVLPQTPAAARRSQSSCWFIEGAAHILNMAQICVGAQHKVVLSLAAWRVQRMVVCRANAR